jgi:prepilin-type N-terminal cleavage/methylation domain-containing protein
MISGLNDRNRKMGCGFTLIELLVVISIIALLLSIILPSLRKAKEVAKSVICTSNQKQIGLTFSMYETEHDGYLIEMFNWGPSGREYDVWQRTKPVRWADRLFYELQYTNSSEIFYCSASKVPEGVSRKWGADYEWGVIGGWETHATYGYGLRAKSFNDTMIQSLKINQIRSPARFILLADSTRVRSIPGSKTYHPFWERTQYHFLDKWHSFYMVHNKAASVLKADMSVGVHKADELIGLFPSQKDWLNAAGVASFLLPPFLYPEGYARDQFGDLTTDY